MRRGKKERATKHTQTHEEETKQLPPLLVSAMILSLQVLAWKLTETQKDVTWLLRGIKRQRALEAVSFL